MASNPDAGESTTLIENSVYCDSLSTTTIHLFGRAEIIDESGGTSTPSAPVAKLLAFLALSRGRAHRRDALAVAIWPDDDRTRSRGYLRRALWQARKALRDSADALLTDHDWIQLAPSRTLAIDVADFAAAHELLRQADGKMDDSLRASCVTAVNMYVGELLEDCAEDWLMIPRDRYRSMYVDMLEWLVNDSWPISPLLAQSYCQRLLDADSAHEWAHRSMMKLLWVSGDRTRALRQFDLCANRLRAELAVDPSAETRQLRDHIVNAAAPSGPPATAITAG